FVRQLVQRVREAKFSEWTGRVGDWRVTIRKGLTAPPTEADFSPMQESVAAESPDLPQEAEGQKSAAPTYLPILSNWVGIVRRQQNGKWLVQVGDTVRKGQTVCWIDALGVRNEVRSPQGGRIVEIFVEDGQPVEFGQQLMLLEPIMGGD
ncbi:MAG: hypothetical protein PVTTEEND_000902, partial [Candidatus Fervidibacter sp.]